MPARLAKSVRSDLPQSPCGLGPGVAPLATRFPISMIRLIDWCETLSVTGYDDPPGSTLNVIAVKPLTVFYYGLVGLRRFKSDIKEYRA